VLRLGPGDGGGVLAPVCVVSVRTPMVPAQRRQAAAQGLVPAGGAVRWDAAAWPVEGAPLVAIGSDLIPGGIPADGSADESASMYRWEDPVWAVAGPLLPPASDGGAWRFALAKPGLHAAMRDTLAPFIAAGDLDVAPHPGFGGAIAGVTSPRWSILPVGVTDAGSGVAAASIAARWDGRPLVVEPDLLRDRVLVELPDSTRAGDHVLELEVADGAGHRTRRTLAVRCGPAGTTGP